MRELPVVWVGSLRDPSGYADEARAYLVSLEDAGLGIGVHDVRWTRTETELTPRQAEAVRRATERRADLAGTVYVHHVVPRHGGGELWYGGPNVARTMFETCSIPSWAWLGRLLEMDEIWVPCDFNVETFARGGVDPERIRVLPETLDWELYAPGIEPLELEPFDGFTFLANFDFTDRKGWDVLLDAWAQAFAPDDGVRLVLKCLGLNGEGPDRIAERVDAYLGGRSTAPIVVDTGILAVAEMPRLYAAADAFVMPSRGEGWGRPFMEAMAMGLPTIGSRFGGNLMFMHDGNAWLVDGEIVPVRDGLQRHTPLYRGQRWFEPDREALVAALREVAAGGPAVRERAAGARAELVERFGPERVAERLVELVVGVRERYLPLRRRLCVWRGDFGGSHSLAVVNDGHVGAIVAAGDSLRTIRPDDDPLPDAVPGVAAHWPPSFAAPSAGPFVLYQPWEFGRVPARWVEEIRRGVDEVWVPSEHTRRGYVASGVPAELVHVVPNGVDLLRFAPDGPAADLGVCAGTVFLFVGGTIHRKGIDVLLDAWTRAFGPGDDVCLVVKGVGAEAQYRGIHRDLLVDEVAARPGTAPVLRIGSDVAFDEMPDLYRAADVLVQPYRGEGFCLPALEALACGVPVIVTAGGPTDEFVPDDAGWRVAADETPLSRDALGEELRLAEEGTLLEPRVEALVAALREAADPDARRRKASQARAAAERYAWERVAPVALERLRALQGRNPVRNEPLASVPGRRGTLFAAIPDWADRETWAPAVRAYAQAFDPGADTTLVLAADDEAEALRLVAAELAASGIGTETIADVVFGAGRSLGPLQLELTADAVIHAAGRAPQRARRVVPPDPAALRAVAGR